MYFCDSASAANQRPIGRGFLEAKRDGKLGIIIIAIFKNLFRPGVLEWADDMIQKFLCHKKIQKAKLNNEHLLKIIILMR
jgi:hypothetical protein